MPTNTTSLASLHASASNIRKLTYMLHGFVFALGSVVVIYAPSIVFFPPSDIAIPSAVLMIAFGLLFIFSYSLTHRASLAGIMTTLFVLALFYHWILNALVVGLILGSLLILGIIRRRISLDDLHATVIPMAPSHPAVKRVLGPGVVHYSLPADDRTAC